MTSGTLLGLFAADTPGSYGAGTLAGLAALISAVTLALVEVGKALRKWLQERRESQTSEQLADARLDSAIAASADVMVIALQRAVTSLEQENRRKDEQLAAKDYQLAQRDQEIERLEHRLRSAQLELQAIAAELAHLREGS